MRAEFEHDDMESNKDNLMRKDDPRYVEATIRQLPSLDDPRERRIIDVLKKKLLTTPWARDTVIRLKEAIIANWQDAIFHLDKPDYVHDVTQKGVKEVALLVNSQIVSGEENIDKLEKKKPVMILSNHLGTFKLISMNPKELREKGIDHSVPNIYYPPVAYYMPFFPVAELLGNNVYEASFEQPLRLGEYFRATGSIDVPPPDTNSPVQSSGTARRTGELVNATRQLFQNRPNAALVIFPEGGTTGKRSGGALYDLEGFKTGAFFIAAKLGVPILPVAQYFNVDRGFQLGVLNPIILEKDKTKEHYEQIGNDIKTQMQVWLDQRKQANQVV